MRLYDGLPFEMSTEATRTPCETVLRSSCCGASRQPYVVRRHSHGQFRFAAG